MFDISKNEKLKFVHFIIPVWNQYNFFYTRDGDTEFELNMVIGMVLVCSLKIGTTVFQVLY